MLFEPIQLSQFEPGHKSACSTSALTLHPRGPSPVKHAAPAEEASEAEVSEAVPQGVRQVQPHSHVLQVLSAAHGQVFEAAHPRHRLTETPVVAVLVALVVRGSILRGFLFGLEVDARM